MRAGIEQSGFAKIIKDARDSRDYRMLTSGIPYASLIGMQCSPVGDDALFTLPHQMTNIGNPLLPAIHGGVIGGFMEMSAALHLMLFMDEPRLPKIIDFSIDYLRSGQPKDTFAQCEVCRQGARVANVAVTAWQSNRELPIAIARGHFKLSKGTV
ncbi:PaaI family thioesterase [Endozoicomonas sp. SCSIO W0465]|uniref:PaaI family thioesterase n=1 Tax=Endozoicomonas sp. SCSIO W0465 TaxID=2918516 RepID=UPI002075502E|nr:PaaI family thioesterase [Endozoicomonas sp. SCSIO W0465]USE39377.1 PaaI family thioesterase [Endozoicomonas sp. SCSIO W0465]